MSASNGRVVLRCERGMTLTALPKCRPGSVMLTLQQPGSGQGATSMSVEVPADRWRAWLLEALEAA